MQDPSWAQNGVNKQKPLSTVITPSLTTCSQRQPFPVCYEVLFSAEASMSSVTGNTVPTRRRDVRVKTHTQGGRGLRDRHREAPPVTAELTQGQPQLPSPRQKGNADIHQGRFHHAFQNCRCGVDVRAKRRANISMLAANPRVR